MFSGKRGVAARGLAEASRGRALKTREDAHKRKFLAARGERQAQRGRALKTREDLKKRKLSGGARREATARQGDGSAPGATLENLGKITGADRTPPEMRRHSI